MYRLASTWCCSVFAIAAACGTTDDRPRTAPYVTDAILVPYCGRASCHSADSAARGLAFDSIPNAKKAFAAMVERDGVTWQVVVPGDSQSSRLYRVLHDTNAPMPPDVPLPDADIELIKAWIDDGAPGYTPP